MITNIATEDDDDIPIELVRRVLAHMRATTLPNDEDGQRMIRKYTRLLRDEEGRRRRERR